MRARTLAQRLRGESVSADRIVSIEVTDDAPATATAECSVHPRLCVDHLTFLKPPEQGWQIVAKAFRTEVRPVV